MDGPNLLNLVSESNRHYHIHLNICSRLDIGSIVALTRTCKALSTVYKQLLPTFWDVDRSLKRFVKNPKGLRSQLAQTGALISGSFVLQFLDRVVWPDSDMDIFQGHTDMYSHKHLKLVDYLIKEEGYEEQLSDVSGSDYNLNDPFRVKTLTRPRANVVDSSGSDRKVDKIQVILSRGETIHAIVTGFWATTVTSVISWNRVYSVYPLATFIDRVLYATNAHTCDSGADWGFSQKHLDSMIEKYTKRGWSAVKFHPSATFFDDLRFKARIGWAGMRSLEPLTEDVLEMLKAPDMYASRDWQKIKLSDLMRSPDTTSKMRRDPFTITRMLADGKTWCIDLDTSGVEAASASNTVLEATSWDFQLVFAPDKRPARPIAAVITLDSAEVQSFPYVHPCLRHSYIFGGLRPGWGRTGNASQARSSSSSTTHKFNYERDDGATSWPVACTRELDKALYMQREKLDPEHWERYRKALARSNGQWRQTGETEETDREGEGGNGNDEDESDEDDEWDEYHYQGAWSVMENLDTIGRRTPGATKLHGDDFEYYDDLLVGWFREWSYRVEHSWKKGVGLYFDDLEMPDL